MSNSVTSWTRLLCPWDSPGKYMAIYWSGLPFPSPGSLPDPRIEPKSPTSRQILYHHTTKEVQSISWRTANNYILDSSPLPVNFKYKLFGFVLPFGLITAFTVYLSYRILERKFERHCISVLRLHLEPLWLLAFLSRSIYRSSVFSLLQM